MSIVCLYLILDEFVGKSRISSLAGLMTPDLSIGGLLKDKIGDVAEKADKVAPDVFYDPNNPEDKEKKSYADKLKDIIDEQNGNKVW